MEQHEQAAAIIKFAESIGNAPPYFMSVPAAIAMVTLAVAKLRLRIEQYDGEFYLIAPTEYSSPRPPPPPPRPSPKKDKR